MDLLDVFDENQNKIGVYPKDVVHQKGMWHQVFGCLCIDSTKNKVYMQYKNASHNAVSNLNKVDISVGGHLVSGERVEDGVREIKEEMGLDVSYDQIKFVGLRKIDVVAKSDYIIREFSYLHVYDSHFDLNTLKSIDDEVLYFIAFDIDELISFVKNPTSIKGETPNGIKTFTEEDFIASYLEEDQYYLKYLLYAKEVIENKTPVRV